jgi:gamma-butyrobetaine dioxygenase
MHPTVAAIAEAFARRGAGRYGSEGVTQLEHALQCAAYARSEGAEAHLVAAALLHDVGHILGDDEMPTSEAESYDDRHEATGYRFLSDSFGARVADPVRLHVLAKRYLCTVDATYEERLSPTSRKSYHDQGGTLSPEELRAFEAEPFFDDAVRLRRWDDAAKDDRARPGTLSDYLPDVEASLGLDADESRRLDA